MLFTPYNLAQAKEYTLELTANGQKERTKC